MQPRLTGVEKNPDVSVRQIRFLDRQVSGQQDPPTHPTDTLTIKPQRM